MTGVDRRDKRGWRAAVAQEKNESFSMLFLEVRFADRTDNRQTAERKGRQGGRGESRLGEACIHSGKTTWKPARGGVAAAEVCAECERGVPRGGTAHGRKT